MADYPACPVCEHNDWNCLAERTYSENDIETADDFNKQIFRFIFDVWFPSSTSIKFDNICCKNCGLITHSPRPTVDDLDKLRQPGSERKTESLPRIDQKIAAKRSRHLYDHIDKYCDLGKIKSVLDYGGMDGSLMKSFIDNGKDCFLIDYYPQTIDGVKKLANTVYDLDKEEKFDLIICSHIIEHLADPRQTLQLLLDHLTRDGIIFVEVPMEVWKKPPLLLQSNPITHVNFFTPSSLANLLTASGASVIKCRLIEYFHTDSHWNPGIICIAERLKTASKDTPLRKPDSPDYIKPGIGTYLKYYFSNPSKLRSELKKRLKF